MIYDPVRQKEFIDTPEEKVRQFIIKYFVEELGYPKCFFKVERKIDNAQNGVFRPDIVIYNPHFNPFILIECKAEDVEINEDSFWQVVKYNKILSAKLIVLTNKRSTYCWRLKCGKYEKSPIPKFCQYKNFY